MTHQESAAFIAAAADLQAGHADAPAQMEALAKAGDPDALMMVGEFRLIGLHGPRDFAKGFRLISRAADRGQPLARRSRVYLTAAGIGRKPNETLARSLLKQLAREDRFVAVQDGLLDHLTCLQRVTEIEPEVVFADPYIAVWRGLFGQAEYGYLRHVGTPHMQRSMIVDPTTGQGVLDPIRDSDTTSVPIIEEDMIVQAINRTIAIATGTKASQGEALTILRYGPSQQYRPHYDAYHEGHPGPQRCKTALIWLNSEYDGGETHFPRLGLTVRGMPGDMIVFDNLTADGVRDDRMEHAGLPVKQGEKWLASRWITTTDLRA